MKILKNLFIGLLMCQSVSLFAAAAASGGWATWPSEQYRDRGEVVLTNQQKQIRNLLIVEAVLYEIIKSDSHRPPEEFSILQMLDMGIRTQFQTILPDSLSLEKGPLVNQILIKEWHQHANIEQMMNPNAGGWKLFASEISTSTWGETLVNGIGSESWYPELLANATETITTKKVGVEVRDFSFKPSTQVSGDGKTVAQLLQELEDADFLNEVTKPKLLSMLGPGFRD